MRIDFPVSEGSVCLNRDDRSDPKLLLLLYQNTYNSYARSRKNRSVFVQLNAWKASIPPRKQQYATLSLTLTIVKPPWYKTSTKKRIYLCDDRRSQTTFVFLFNRVKKYSNVVLNDRRLPIQSCAAKKSISSKKVATPWRKTTKSTTME